ncbi:MAG: DUF2490 domain-containing protein [Bdellovibrionales bacterium]
MVSINAWALDEYWAILQFKKQMSSDHFLLLEYVERDKTNFFENKNLGLTRLSFGGTVGSFKYLIGGAYVDFTSSADERRLHQFLISSYSLESLFTFPLRIGLEERSFIGDEKIYLRGRLRVQANFLPQYKIGLVAYNEAFYIPNGYNKFVTGLNENRFGFGIRYITNEVEVYLYKTQADIKNISQSRHLQWIQLQTLINF